MARGDRYSLRGAGLLVPAHLVQSHDKEPKTECQFRNEAEEHKVGKQRVLRPKKVNVCLEFIR